MIPTPPRSGLLDDGSGGGVLRFPPRAGLLLLVALAGIACGGADEASPLEPATPTGNMAASGPHDEASEPEPGRGGGDAEPRGEPSILFDGDPDSPGFGTVLVAGLSPEALDSLRRAPLDEFWWTDIFPVYTGAALPASGEHPSILGTWTVEDDLIRFTPQFAPATGIDYTALFHGPLFDSLTGNAYAGSPVRTLTFSMPDPDVKPSTVVEAVHPGDGTIPENLLRVYIHFSAPMKVQKVHGAIHLYDDSGEEVTLPFVEIPEGLWDRRHRRLTLIFHPGRLKRGVGPNQAMGTPLREGRRYRLVVDDTLEDAQGYPLASEFETRFKVGPADRSSPDPHSWELFPPSAPEASLRVVLDEPLDRALLARFLTVEDEAGRGVQGSVEIGHGARGWTFTPAESWTPGRYALVAHPALEDLAGNTPAGLFDTDTRDALPDRSKVTNPIRLTFHIGS